MKRIVSLIFIFSILSCCQSKPVSNRSDALWNFVSQQCLPKASQGLPPTPCDEVSSQGYVIFKDRIGPVQYLLMPTAKITGVEDPELLKKDQKPNYFWESWKARSYVIKRYKAPIPDEELSLTVNSQFGRTQNHLHIHISCTSPEVKSAIQKNRAAITKTWSFFPGGLKGSEYFVRRLTEDELKNTNIFSLIAESIPEAKENMNQFGIAVVPVKEKKKLDFALLVVRADVTKMNGGHAEEIQDHDCPQLSPELLKKAQAEGTKQ